MNADIEPGPAISPDLSTGQQVRRHSLAALLSGALRLPLRSLAWLAGACALPFGLARSRRSVLRDGWILGDKDR